MKCLNCPLEVVPDGKAHVHVNGLYGCGEAAPGKYAEPGVQGVGEPEKKFCRCAAAAVGSCENCQTPLCAGCDSEEFVDVMCCRDKGACEKALRRKAVAEHSGDIFEAKGGPFPVPFLYLRENSLNYDVAGPGKQQNIRVTNISVAHLGATEAV